ncbi:hypothetical protein C2I19_02215 [Chromobacterium alticapitis]|uniref:Uncharacterized protein n=1 Tax=Chromobacterium alticapitis TaxID=2073169 RepID=A0A2S5DKZ1_9NEIS|nr:hypothetical protein C2I19_02215 [Chromobacterium alticapitis]
MAQQQTLPAFHYRFAHKIAVQAMEVKAREASLRRQPVQQQRLIQMAPQIIQGSQQADGMQSAGAESPISVSHADSLGGID